MSEIVKLINSTEWWTLTRDVDFSLLWKSLLTGWVIEWLALTQSWWAWTDITLWSWEAFVEVTRDNVTPNEEFIVVYRNTDNVILTAWNNKKIFIEIEANNVNNPDLNIEQDWTNIWSVKIADTLPTKNYLLLAETDWTWLLTLVDNKIKTKRVGWNLVLTPSITDLDANYTFDWTEINNTQFNVDTTSWNITLDLDLSLFPTTNWLYQFTIVKTAWSNSVILDLWTATIDWNTTYQIWLTNESITFVIESDTKAKVVSTSNAPTSVDIENQTESLTMASDTELLIFKPWQGLFKINRDNLTENFKQASETALWVIEKATPTEALNWVADKYADTATNKATFFQDMKVWISTSTTWTITYTHNLGKTPKMIKITWMDELAQMSIWYYDNTNNTQSSMWGNQSVNGWVNSSYAVSRIWDNTWLVQNVTDTTFQIVWSWTTYPRIMWEVI